MDKERETLSDCESIIRSLDEADLFLRNRTQDRGSPLNEYDIEAMLDIAEVCKKASDKLRVMQKLGRDFIELVMKSEDTCKYCKNDIECKGKECDKYIEGKGLHDKNGKYFDWNWSCEDFNFGTCDMLIDTPCNGCIENNNKGFEWRG